MRKRIAITTLLVSLPFLLAHIFTNVYLDMQAVLSGFTLIATLTAGIKHFKLKRILALSALVSGPFVFSLFASPSLALTSFLGGVVLITTLTTAVFESRKL